MIINKISKVPDGNYNNSFVVKNKFNICILYLVICVLCALNGILYAPGGFISRGLQYLLIIISVFYTFYANSKYKLPVYFKALNVLLIMFTIYGLIFLIYGNQLQVSGLMNLSRTDYLKNIFKSLLPIYAFYVFAKEGLLTEKVLKFWFFVFLIITINSFYQSQASLLQEAIELGMTREEFVTNVGYAFVGLLPCLVLFQKKPFVQYILLAVCLFFVVMSMKRGAILTGAICAIWFMSENTKSASKKTRWVVALVSLAFVIAAVYFYLYRLNTSSYFSYRINQTFEGDSSGRNDLYNIYIRHFLQEDNAIRFLFGYGANGTVKIGGNFAHNDWLEIAINQGVLGILIYLVYWISLVNTWRKSKMNKQAFMAIGMFIIVYFMSTLFSMSYDSVTRCAAMSLGYFIATYSVENKLESIKY